MRLEWLEDVLAVLETGSFIKAAERRFLTQPAFSRRIKLLENHIGIELFDRSKKPVQLKQTVIDQQQTIQELATGLRDLRNELKRQERETHNRIVIASQHAITASLGPALVKKLSIRENINIRLRSANRDECYSMLITNKADFILTHQTENEQIPLQEGIVEQFNLGRERFIPVYATDALHKHQADYAKGNISVVAYPVGSFLGQVINQEIFSQLWHTTTIHKIAETALTLATLSLALAGVGVTWLPYSLAAPDLAGGRLTDLSDSLPSCELFIVAMRLKEPASVSKDTIWEIITAH